MGNMQQHLLFGILFTLLVQGGSSSVNGTDAVQAIGNYTTAANNTESPVTAGPATTVGYTTTVGATTPPVHITTPPVDATTPPVNDTTPVSDKTPVPTVKTTPAHSGVSNVSASLLLSFLTVAVFKLAASVH